MKTNLVTEGMIWVAIFLLSLYWDTFPRADGRAAVFQRRYKASLLLTIIKWYATVFAREGVSSPLTPKPATMFSKYKWTVDEMISSCPASAQDRSVFQEQSPLQQLHTHFAGLLGIPAHWGKLRVLFQSVRQGSWVPHSWRERKDGRTLRDAETRNKELLATSGGE